MLPHEKELTARYANRPFALVGVDSDGDRSIFMKILQDNNLDFFRSAVAGAKKSKIPTSWQVVFWPTVYLIDPDGKVVYGSVGAPDAKILDAQVELAVAKAEAEKRGG